MDISTYLVNEILASEREFFALGILGQRGAGKQTLAESLTEQLHLVNRQAETILADDIYYIEIMPGVRMHRSDLARDIREFQEGTRIFVAGGDRIEPDTRVLLILATLQNLPTDLDAWEALDYRVFVTVRNGRQLLQRRFDLEERSKEDCSPGRSEAEIVGEVTQEQLRERRAIDMVRRAECVWFRDTNEIGVFGGW